MINVLQRHRIHSCLIFTYDRLYLIGVIQHAIEKQSHSSMSIVLHIIVGYRHGYSSNKINR
jgi:hypothetical protein